MDEQEKFPIDLSNNNRVIGLRWIRSGQSRPYADSVYEAELTFTGKNICTKADLPPLVCGCHPPEVTVKALSRILVSNWSNEAVGCATYLDKIECTDKGDGFSRWIVRVVSPFND
jgi:hypothetical protein